MKSYPFAVLGDNPIDPEAGDQDLLGYGRFVKPFGERIETSRDVTPFTVGIFAEWGQGKSTLMKLLELDLKARDANIIPLWFFPWKYHTREEVWRGLVMSLITEIQANDTLLSEFKRKRKALETLAAKGLWRGMATLLGGQAKWADELVDAVSKEPWSPQHMHLFERELNDLFAHLESRRASGQAPLIVLFVDDLDRCLPEPTAAVLEAMKLVLNRRGLITILGIAEEQVHQSVEAHYRAVLGEVGSKQTADDPGTSSVHWGPNYLKKIIQIPLYLPRPSNAELEAYVSHCITSAKLDQAIGEKKVRDWAAVLRWVCDENLREVKRFLNRFIAEWDKLLANRVFNSSGDEVTPEFDADRVLFMLASDQVRRGFLKHCQGASSSRFLLYQKSFLAPESTDSVEELRDEFVNDPLLQRLFLDCLSEQRDQASLVKPFRLAHEVTVYLRFGRISLEAEPDSDLATDMAETPEPDLADEMDASVAATSMPPHMAKKATKKQSRKGDVQSGLTALLKDAHEALSAADIGRVEGLLRDSERLVFKYSQLNVFSELAEIHTGLAMLTQELWRIDDFWKRVEEWRNGEAEPNRTYAIASSETSKAAVLRQLIQARGATEDDKMQVELAQQIERLIDHRPGVGLLADGLPDIAWIEIDRPANIDTLSPGFSFFMAEFLVTQAQFRAFLNDPDVAHPDWWEGTQRDGPSKHDSGSYERMNLPVNNVTWFDALAFSRWLDRRLRETGQHPNEDWVVRLPLEAEWSFGANAGRDITYPWGEEYQPGYANVNESGARADGLLPFLAPVGLFPLGNSEFGVSDLIGQLWEWTLTPGKLGDRQEHWNDLSSDFRVVKGGSWYELPEEISISRREAPSSWGDLHNVGFRLCCGPAIEE